MGSNMLKARGSYLSTKILFKNPAYLRIFILFLVSAGVFLSKTKAKVTENLSDKNKLIPPILVTGLAYVFLYNIYYITGLNQIGFMSILIFSIVLFFLYIKYLSDFKKILISNLSKDRFQKEERRFDQFNELLVNDDSVNIQTEDGWVNIVNPFRASQVLGTPGSGKSYSFLIEALIQHIQKGFCILLYDYKYPSLAIIAYNALKKHYTSYKKTPQFCIINFDDLTRSNRCNPIQPDLLFDSSDATAASQALMYGLYPKWAQKQGEFFPESAINYAAACIWTLKLIDGGKYCTLPHLIQFMNLDYDSIFKIMKEQKDEYINNVASPFISAYDNKATDQLEGQIATTKIALSRLTSPKVYWVMTTDDTDNTISLQINDPNNPKILVLCNNPDKALVYSPILSLYNTRLMRLINKPKMQKTAVMFDELPTLSFAPGTLDNLIATARSNRIAVWLGFQDFAQLNRDLGKDIAEAIINTVGNTFSGMVNFDTAKKLSEKFGKIKIKKESLTISNESNSMSISTQMEDIVPPSEISSLEQGVFVGQVADDRGYEISQKVFYSKILIDHKERATYEEGEIPPFVTFEKSIEETVNDNFQKIKREIIELAEAYNLIGQTSETSND
jgi:energy-coupling factor transporter transmembrane protein EcfT